MSKAFRQGTFLQPPDRKHIVEQSVAAHEKKKRIRREANLYDAVAGVQRSQVLGMRLK